MSLHFNNIILGHQTQLAHWLLSKVERVSFLSLFLYPVRFIHPVYWKVPFKSRIKLFFLFSQSPDKLGKESADPFASFRGESHCHLKKKLAKSLEMIHDEKSDWLVVNSFTV